MRRNHAPLRTRLAALALELLGVCAVLYAVSRWNLWVAIGLAGVLLVIAAQLGEAVL